MSPRTPAERAPTRARLDAQLLGGPRATGTEQVLERLLAVQAQGGAGPVDRPVPVGRAAPTTSTRR
ncbi:MAG TPA: hypothetical protein VMV06_05165 [Acidimicrobiales bacterium]|nr:hypothetical protein [Acidimicrobiales bacterium]HVB93048.1 hypothetical protein [Acidimicrobiales bacterium]